MEALGNKSFSSPAVQYKWNRSVPAKLKSSSPFVHALLFKKTYSTKISEASRIRTGVDIKEIFWENTSRDLFMLLKAKNLDAVPFNKNFSYGWIHLTISFIFLSLCFLMFFVNFWNYVRAERKPYCFHRYHIIPIMQLILLRLTKLLLHFVLWRFANIFPFIQQKLSLISFAITSCTD